MTVVGNSPRAADLPAVLNGVGVTADRQARFQRALDEGGDDLRAVVEVLVGDHPALCHVDHFAAVRAASVPLLLGAARAVATTGIEFELMISDPNADGPLATVTVGDERIVAEVRALPDDEDCPGSGTAAP
ncbi:MAG TPA: hypothetical protein VN257_04825 [Actinotalea sp.]|nr:hypothetical protein [Actinotalea sp.]